MSPHSNREHRPVMARSPHVYQLDADVVLYALPDLVPMPFHRNDHIRYLGHEATGHRFLRWCPLKGVWDDEVVYETPTFPKMMDKNNPHTRGGEPEMQRTETPSFLPRPKIVFLGPLPFLVPPGLEGLFEAIVGKDAPAPPLPEAKPEVPEATPDDIDAMLAHLRAAQTQLQTARAKAFCPKCVEKIRDIENAAGYLVDEMEKAATAYRALDKAKVTGRWEDLPDDVKQMIKSEVVDGR